MVRDLTWVVGRQRVVIGGLGVLAAVLAGGLYLARRPEPSIVKVDTTTLDSAGLGVLRGLTSGTFVTATEVEQLVAKECTATYRTPSHDSLRTYQRAKLASVPLVRRFVGDSGLAFVDSVSSDTLKSSDGTEHPYAFIAREAGACGLKRSDWRAGGRIVAKVGLTRGTFKEYDLRRPSTVGAADTVSFYLWVGPDTTDGVFRGLMIPTISGTGARTPFTFFYNRNVVQGASALSDGAYGCLRRGELACWVYPPYMENPQDPDDITLGPHSSATQIWVLVGNSCVCSGYGCH